MGLCPPDVPARAGRPRIRPFGGTAAPAASTGRTATRCGPRTIRAPTAISCWPLRRLTRLHVRSVEQPVNLDEGGVYDWPWLYAVQTGHWQLTDTQAKTLREYLLRGGFFMADDFWGPTEWEIFMDSMKQVFPDRQVVDLDNEEAIFHAVYDLDDRYQVASHGSVMRGVSFKCDGCPDHWRGIFDDHGRLMVAMTYQSDVGDSWEWADDPYYPERYAALGIRIGVNYVIYAMTH